MSSILTRLSREPNAITGLVTAGINLAVLFGWDLTAEQIAGINTFLGAVFIAIRYVTTPTAEVVAQRKPGEATKAGPASVVPTGTPVEVVTGPQPPPED